MISEKIKSLILGRIDFANAEVLEAVENLATASADLATAGEQYDDVFPEGSGDAAADGALNLADAFAAVANPDKIAFVKEAFNAVYYSTTPEQETAGEALFAAALDLDLAANKINELLTPVE